MFTERKIRLLEDAQSKPVQTFLQFDAFTRVGNDDCIRPDEEGDCLMLSAVTELRRTDCIRLQFTPDTPVADVARMLRKMITWLESPDLGNLEEVGHKEEMRQRLLDIEMRTGSRTIIEIGGDENIPF